MTKEKDYPEHPDVVTQDGEVLSSADVAYAYSREGRHKIGKEFPNPVPMAPPIGYVPQIPIHEQIRAMVLRSMAEQEGAESFEDADDFEVDDDYDPSTPYEEQFEPTEPWPATAEVAALQKQIDEFRSATRAPTLRAELEALRAGGGGAQPPSGEPAQAAPAAAPAKATA